jgi:hypothetical protein
MSGQQSRPGRGTQPAGESRTLRVDQASDSPRSTLAWLQDLVGAGLKHRTLVVALAMSPSSSLRFPIDVDDVAAVTGYARSTVMGAIADLIRAGLLRRVRHSGAPDYVFTRQHAYGCDGRWVPKPALFRLTMRSTGSETP